MKHIEGIGHNQITIIPDAVEDYFSKEKPVRFLDAFVENLDLAKLGLQGVGPPTADARPAAPAIFSVSSRPTTQSEQSMFLEGNRNTTRQTARYYDCGVAVYKISSFTYYPNILFLPFLSCHAPPYLPLIAMSGNFYDVISIRPDPPNIEFYI